MGATLSFALPRNDDNAVDGCFAPQVNHPHGMIDEVIVDNGTPVQRRVQVSIDSQSGPAVLPILPQMAFVVEPRISMMGHICN